MTTPVATPPALPGRPYNSLARVTDRLMKIFCTASAFLAILCLVLIIGYVFYQGVSSLNLSLFTKYPGSPKPVAAVSGIGKTITLVRRDAYLTPGQAIDFVENYDPQADEGIQVPDLPPNTTITLTVRERVKDVPADAGPVIWTKTGRLETIAGKKALHFQASGHDTAQLAKSSFRYAFQVAAAAPGKEPEQIYSGTVAVQDRTGLLNGIQGTLVLILLASLIGVPVGIACGTYLSEYARAGWFPNAIRLIIDVLIGVPSILVGVLAYELVITPPVWLIHAIDACLHLLNRNWSWNPGQSAWAGTVALAFIMIPIVARTTEEMLKLVPQSYREASVGVGASKAQTIFRIVLPAARSGIITGVMLAIARVAGETAPLIFTVLGSNSPVFNFQALQEHGSGKPFVDLNHPFPALTLQIYNYAGSGQDEWIRQAWAGMLVLVSLILILNLAVRFVSRNRMAGPR